MNANLHITTRVFLAFALFSGVVAVQARLIGMPTFSAGWNFVILQDTNALEWGLLRVWERCGWYKNFSASSFARPLPPSLALCQDFISHGVFYALPFVLSMILYHLLRRYCSRDGGLRCRKCRHLLRKLAEPRCPNCGEWI